jgi:hypothetical protein
LLLSSFCCCWPCVLLFFLGVATVVVFLVNYCTSMVVCQCSGVGVSSSGCVSAVEWVCQYSIVEWVRQCSGVVRVLSSNCVHVSYLHRPSPVSLRACHSSSPPAERPLFPAIVDVIREEIALLPRQTSEASMLMPTSSSVDTVEMTVHLSDEAASSAVDLVASQGFSPGTVEFITPRNTDPLAEPSTVNAVQSDNVAVPRRAQYSWRQQH